MPTHIEKITISTPRRENLQLITAQVKEVVQNAVKKGITDGVCRVFVPHTTAGVTINENADPAVENDFVDILRKFIPDDPNYRHMEGNSDSHVKASLVGSTSTIILASGELILGTWQGIFFCEFDGPRNRNVIIQIQGE